MSARGVTDPHIILFTHFPKCLHESTSWSSVGIISRTWTLTDAKWKHMLGGVQSSFMCAQHGPIIVMPNWQRRNHGEARNEDKSSLVVLSPIIWVQGWKSGSSATWRNNYYQSMQLGCFSTPHNDHLSSQKVLARTTSGWVPLCMKWEQPPP